MNIILEGDPAVHELFVSIAEAGMTTCGRKFWYLPNERDVDKKLEVLERASDSPASCALCVAGHARNP